MLDPVDVQIIDLLGNNGRMPILSIAKKLDLPNSTVRKRIKKLEDTGIIQFSCEVNLKKFPQVLIMFVGIEASKKYRSQLEEIYKIPNILHVSGSTGRYDYIAMFAATSRDMVIDVIGNNLHNIRGISRTESFLLLKDIGIFIKSDKFAKLFITSNGHDGEKPTSETAKKK
ncbi:Lrp/AsnC family transcriptional regulator [bacterium]|nr:Lrp/AsnC family transcriptional regulator [bacterium]